MPVPTTPPTPSAVRCHQDKVGTSLCPPAWISTSALLRRNQLAISPPKEWSGGYCITATATVNKLTVDVCPARVRLLDHLHARDRRQRGTCRPFLFFKRVFCRPRDDTAGLARLKSLANGGACCHCVAICGNELGAPPES